MARPLGVWGCPPGLPVELEAIQSAGSSPAGPSRRYAASEADRVEVLSGVIDGVATGTPISLLKDADSSKYDALKATYRGVMRITRTTQNTAVAITVGVGVQALGKQPLSSSWSPG